MNIKISLKIKKSIISESFRHQMASREAELIEENARLHGKVKALEYEVEMLTMLAKNIIYGNFLPGSSFQHQNETWLVPSSVVICRVLRAGFS